MKESEETKTSETGTAREELKEAEKITLPSEKSIRATETRVASQTERAQETTEVPSNAATEPKPEAAPTIKEQIEQPSPVTEGSVQPSPGTETSNIGPDKGINFQREGFSINLPEGWKEIPRDILDAYEDSISKQVGQGLD